MNKKFTEVVLTTPYSCLESRGYLDEDGRWYRADAIVDHPCNTAGVTYGQLDPTKYRLVDFSEPFDKRMEWWDSCRKCWCNEHSGQHCYFDSTHRIALDLPPLDPIAPGHNPAKLIVSQVGNGYRLLTPEELKLPKRMGHCWLWLSDSTCWAHATDDIHDPCCTYKTDLPPGKYVVQKKTVPKTLADLPKRPFWRKLGEDVHAGPAGTITNNFNSHYMEVYIKRGDTYAESFDGPWLPFTKEVECE